LGIFAQRKEHGGGVDGARLRRVDYDGTVDVRSQHEQVRFLGDQARHVVEGQAVVLFRGQESVRLQPRPGDEDNDDDDDVVVVVVML